MQTIGARFAHGEITLRRRPSSAAAPAPRPAAAASSSAPRPRRRSSPRRSGCRCRTRALAPSGQPIWLDMARRSAARAAATGSARHRRRATSSPTPRSATRWSSTPPSAARPTCCCTSRRSPTPPACRGPTVDDWIAVNRQVPRLVDALPNGPSDHPTVRVFLAGGVPEVMLHLRELGPARRLDALTVTGETARRRARLVGSDRAPQRAARAAASSATASIPTTSS